MINTHLTSIFPEIPMLILIFYDIAFLELFLSLYRSVTKENLCFDFCCCRNWKKKGVEAVSSFLELRRQQKKSYIFGI